MEPATVELAVKDGKNAQSAALAAKSRLEKFRRDRKIG